MNLPTAIRLGSLTSTPTFHAYQKTRNSKAGKRVFTCALGAAFIGLMGRPRRPSDHSIIRTLEQAFPVLETAWPANDAPPCGCEVVRRFLIGRVVTHLNDVHAWSREAIADMLDEAGLG